MIRRRPIRWSLTAQLALIAAVFAAIPAILYGEFEAADRAKANLLRQTVQDQGRTIATAIAPSLTLKPDGATALEGLLRQFAGPRMVAKVLFRPAAAVDQDTFFYIAASRSVEPAQLASEREELERQGVLGRLQGACALERPTALRYRTPMGGEQLITAVVPVLNDAGCWLVVTSFADSALLASSLGREYWQTTEIRVAAAIFMMSAVLVLALFMRVWRNLRRFSAVAAEIRMGNKGGVFAARNTVPELDPIAQEVDRMVESLRKLSGAVEGSASPIVITDARGRIEYVNPAFCELTGYAAAELIGQDLSLLRAPETPPDFYAALWATIARGDVWRGELCSRKKNGDRYWALVSISCLHDDSGQISSYITVQEDITERKRTERQKAMLVAELNHRVKNSLATVKSIAGQMLRQVGSLETFKSSFEGRLQALSQAHDLLTCSSWEGADLQAIVRRSLEPFDRTAPSPIAIEGPPLTLVPRAALVLSMTFHEMATNAVKYGALSAAAGRVTVLWRLERDGSRETLVIIWREGGGPTVRPPTRRGFGSSLIERSVTYELDATVNLQYAEEGLHCEIRIPWPIGGEATGEDDLAAAA